MQIESCSGAVLFSTASTGTEVESRHSQLKEEFRVGGYMAQRGRISKLEGTCNWAGLSCHIPWLWGIEVSAVESHGQTCGNRWKKKVSFDSQAWAIIYTGGARISRDPPSLCLLWTSFYWTVLQVPERSAHGVDEREGGGSERVYIPEGGASVYVCVGGNLHGLQDPSHF